MAQAYLKAQKPRVMWISLVNSDDWAHADRYDRYLDYLHLADKLLGELWADLQSMENYRDQTTLIITTDHGRGLQGSDWSVTRHQHPRQRGDLACGYRPGYTGYRRNNDTWNVLPGAVAATLLHYLGTDYSELGPNALQPIVN